MKIPLFTNDSDLSKKMEIGAYLFDWNVTTCHICSLGNKISFLTYLRLWNLGLINVTEQYLRVIRWGEPMMFSLFQMYLQVLWYRFRKAILFESPWFQLNVNHSYGYSASPFTKTKRERKTDVDRSDTNTGKSVVVKWNSNFSMWRRWC